MKMYYKYYYKLFYKAGNNLDKKITVCGDIQVCRHLAGGPANPPALCVANLKLNIVIVDSEKKTLHVS